MPIPQCHIIHLDNVPSNNGSGEYSSTSSMSTASVSPANSSSSHSQSSPSQQQPLNSKSSYLLTTATSPDHPPSYSTLKRGSKSFITEEKHYNNSNQSISDGNF